MLSEITRAAPKSKLASTFATRGETDENIFILADDLIVQIFKGQNGYFPEMRFGTYIITSPDHQGLNGDSDNQCL